MDGRGHPAITSSASRPSARACPRLDRLPGRDLSGGLRLAEARSPLARTLGLALLDEMPPNYALRIPRCGSVHTFGMRFALDVIFLDGEGRLVRTAEAVPPRRFAAARGAHAVIETRAGMGRCFIAAGSLAE